MSSFGNYYSLNTFNICPSFGNLGYASAPSKSTLAPLENDTFIKTTTAKEPLIKKSKDGKTISITEYDPATGNKIKDKLCKADGTILGIAEYNPITGKQIKLIGYDNGKIFSINEYDPKTGKILKHVGYQDDGKTLKQTREINPLKEAEKTIWYQKDGITIDNIVEIDSIAGRETMTWYREDGKTVESIQEWKLLPRNKVKSIYYREDGKTIGRIEKIDPTTGISNRELAINSL